MATQQQTRRVPEPPLPSGGGVPAFAIFNPARDQMPRHGRLQRLAGFEHGSLSGGMGTYDFDLQLKPRQALRRGLRVMPGKTIDGTESFAILSIGNRQVALDSELSPVVESTRGMDHLQVSPHTRDDHSLAPSVLHSGAGGAHPSEHDGVSPRGCPEWLHHLPSPLVDSGSESSSSASSVSGYSVFSAKSHQSTATHTSQASSSVPEAALLTATPPAQRHGALTPPPPPPPIPRAAHYLHGTPLCSSPRPMSRPPSHQSLASLTEEGEQGASSHAPAAHPPHTHSPP